MVKVHGSKTNDWGQLLLSVLV